MPVVACPACSTKLSLPDNAPSNQMFQCPKCKQPIGLNGPPAAAPIPAAMPMAAPMTGGFRCPYCQAAARPRIEQKITQAGWVVFTILILSVIGIPFCWIPLIGMKEEVRSCSQCGMKLG